MYAACFRLPNNVSKTVSAKNLPLISLGIPCFGPSAAAARIESSKSFAKSLMDKYDIPTADWKQFTDPEEATDYVKG